MWPVELIIDKFIQDRMYGRTNKLLVILRGIPGSGKTTMAAEVGTYCFTNGLVPALCSADLYFVGPHAYAFDKSQLPAAHRQCQERAKGLLASPEVDVICVDNTSLTKAEVDVYKAMAGIWDTTVVVEFACADKDEAEELIKRNTHGVPIGKASNMLKNYEQNWSDYTVYPCV